MIATGGNLPVPFVFGTGASGTFDGPNTLGGNGSGNAGGSYIVSIVGTTVTITDPTLSSGAGTNTLIFCPPAISIPLQWNYNTHFPVVVVGNSYSNTYCGLGSDGS